VSSLRPRYELPREEVDALLRAAAEMEEQFEPELRALHPAQTASARNLIHYLALRQHDIRPLQDRLTELGLSSIGRSEAHAVATLRQVASVLDRLAGDDPDVARLPPSPVDFVTGPARLRAQTAALLGDAPEHRDVRIMVTMPTLAAEDPLFCADALRAGMDCARINCAHDSPDVWRAILDHLRRACAEAGRSCRVLMDLPGPKLRTGELDEDTVIRLAVGDPIILVRESAPGVSAIRDEKGAVRRAARISCSPPAIFETAREGDPIWFDDGKLGGRIRSNDGREIEVLITHAKPGGIRLKSARGVNLPATDLDLPAVTEHDLDHLDFVAAHADIVALSFVNSPDDITLLQDRLRALGAEAPALVFKVETRRGFENLPRILLAAMRSYPIGVMIARGDLAVECGFERLAEVQEEILWICEAAHVPTVWATQVLENLAKTGRPSRAEVTDAAMSVRAECVMLNKGPHILRAIATLHDILIRMQEHQEKKRSLLRPLRVSRNL
jgi:pyruvate kinase